MKTAIIAPSQLLPRYAVTGYHLALCHMILSDSAYGKFYYEASNRGDFIILDNSAHELGEGLTSAMEEAADMILPDEVVLPDRLFNAEDTVDFAHEHIELFRHLTPNTTRVMGVPQGTTEREWNWCCRQLINLGVDTIGISKDYEGWKGGIWGRVCSVRDIAEDTWHAQVSAIHLLGWGRKLHQLQQIRDRETLPFQKLFGKYTRGLPIRGIDSGKPLVYAWGGVDLRQNGTPKYPKRSPSFFKLTDEDIPEELALININEFRKAAGDL